MKALILRVQRGTLRRPSLLALPSDWAKSSLKHSVLEASGWLTLEAGGRELGRGSGSPVGSPEAAPGLVRVVGKQTP